MKTLVLLLSLAVSACAAGAGSMPGQSVAGPSGVEGYPGWPGAGTALGISDLVPVIVSTELAVGRNRFLFTLVDAQNRLLAAPDLKAQVAFYDLARDPSRGASRADGRFIWSIEGERGLYASTADFARAGDWGAEVTAHAQGKPDRSARVVFSVREKPATPAIGAQAPRSETPAARTAADIRKISTDQHPDPDFYRLSITQAVKSGRPTVLIFATPLFCQSQTCGPTLDTVKSVAAPYEKRVNFVHVEPYRLKVEDDQLQPDLDASGQFQAVDAVKEWGLLTEPYTFVIDAQGRVTAKFEGVVAKEELVSAIEAVLR